MLLSHAQGRLSMCRNIPKQYSQTTTKNPGCAGLSVLNIMCATAHFQGLLCTAGSLISSNGRNFGFKEKPLLLQGHGPHISPS